MVCNIVVIKLITNYCYCDRLHLLLYCKVDLFCWIVRQRGKLAQIGASPGVFDVNSADGVQRRKDNKL